MQLIHRTIPNPSSGHKAFARALSARLRDLTSPKTYARRLASPDRRRNTTISSPNSTPNVPSSHWHVPALTPTIRRRLDRDCDVGTNGNGLDSVFLRFWSTPAAKLVTDPSRQLLALRGRLEELDCCGPVGERKWLHGRSYGF